MTFLSPEFINFGVIKESGNLILPGPKSKKYPTKKPDFFQKVVSILVYRAVHFYLRLIT